MERKYLSYFDVTYNILVDDRVVYTGYCTVLAYSRGHAIRQAKKPGGPIAKEANKHLKDGCHVYSRLVSLKVNRYLSGYGSK